MVLRADCAYRYPTTFTIKRERNASEAAVKIVVYLTGSTFQILLTKLFSGLAVRLKRSSHLGHRCTHPT